MVSKNHPNCVMTISVASIYVQKSHFHQDVASSKCYGFNWNFWTQWTQAKHWHFGHWDKDLTVTENIVVWTTPFQLFPQLKRYQIRHARARDLILFSRLQKWLLSQVLSLSQHVLFYCHAIELERGHHILLIRFQLDILNRRFKVCSPYCPCQVQGSFVSFG